MTFIYGLPAVEVTDAEGEVTVYLLRQVVPEGDERRAYVLTKEDGTENRVSDHGHGHWRCTCRDWLYRSRFNVEKQGRCKHAAGIVEALTPAPVEEEASAV